MREAEIYGDPALFLLRQPIGIIARKRRDQRAFAVINMTGRGQDSVAGGIYCLLRAGRRLNSKVAFTGTSLPLTSRCGPKK